MVITLFISSSEIFIHMAAKLLVLKQHTGYNSIQKQGRVSTSAWTIPK